MLIIAKFYHQKTNITSPFRIALKKVTNLNFVANQKSFDDTVLIVVQQLSNFTWIDEMIPIFIKSR
jgi:hypothetical protein